MNQPPENTPSSGPSPHSTPQHQQHSENRQQQQSFYTPPVYSPPYPLSTFSPYPPHYFQPPVFPVQPAWQHSSFPTHPYYPWTQQPLPRDSSPSRPRRRHPDRPRTSVSRGRDHPRSDYDDEDLTANPTATAHTTAENHLIPNNSDVPASPSSSHQDTPTSANSNPSHRRAPRRRAPDRRDHHPHLHHHQKHSLDPDPTADLDKAAKKAVDTADDVTLVLLLTSWANSLGEAPHATASAAHFETVFHASRGLEIVTGDVLLSPRLAHHPAVRNALVALLARVLYADAAVHDTFASALVRLNTALAARDDRDRDACLRHRQVALRNVLNFLRDLAANISAYVHILPANSDHLPEPNSRSPATKPSAAPAGPDPTKAVERSMDTWRRAVARLQGEMAIIVVISNAQRALDRDFRTPSDSAFHELDEFYVTVRDAVHAYISNDLIARRYALAEVHWPAVLQGADNTVFAAAQSRASLWLSQFETACRDVESQLDDAGIGFGPPARVSSDKFAVLVSASARVAALVSCHQHSFSWANDTARLLSSMVTAFRCLERVADGTLCPSQVLRATFFRGLDVAFAAIDEVVNWSFSSLHDKVLGSLEKSCSNDKQVGDTNPPKVRQLRFEEPPKTPSKETSVDGSGTPAVHSRRKPRHERIKSSPDALLHLNAHAHFDDYSDDEIDVNRNIDITTDRDGDREGEQTATTISDGTTSIGASYDTVERRETGDVANKSDERNNDVSQRRVEDELPVVYEGQPLEYGEDEDDDDDRDIIVHEDLDDSARTPKKVNHTSHIRSMSVDGIPF